MSTPRARARACRSCCLLLLLLLVSHSVAAPLHESDGHAMSLPLPALGSLTSRVTSLGGGGEGRDPRLPLPSLQDIDTIRKVAQILIMLGEQVIPAIIGEPAPRAARPQCCSVEPVPPPLGEVDE